ncbi:TipAS antibiotic-recognition domain-containing protein [Subtercola sp. Z020]|uniref:MerR family transcriptional regulator n=1 Tax=Subtercola sp. Z020 TaxID=2080582 RepID=UPI001E6599C6|nr:TipAS antibiotic-recognition domain-containing protein [Subtercola sp. Z020]
MAGITNDDREWTIQQTAALARTTSRTLRHYDELGLLVPSRVGANGYRYYDAAALLRLQRILLLRQLGLGLPAIAGVLANAGDPASTLGTHLEWLRSERQRLDTQIAAVQQTLDGIQKEEPLMADTMFDGFDHTQHEREVIERWGPSAYAHSDSWWRGLTDAEQHAFTAEGRATAADFAALRAAGADAAGAAAQALAARHVAWLARALGGAAAGGGAPVGSGGITAEYLVGLGDLYASDERFGRTYDRHGAGTAASVRDALRAYAATLPD